MLIKGVVSVVILNPPNNTVMIQWLEGIIDRVENEVDGGYVFDMGDYGYCVLGTLDYGYSVCQIVSKELGFCVTSLDYERYKERLTETQAEVISLFTTIYGDELTKEKWLIIAKDVLVKLGDKDE